MLIFVAAFGGFGAWILLKGAHDVVEAAQSAHWPATLGNVTSSTVVRTHSSARHSGGSSYRPDIRYTFLVNHRAYRNTMISPGRVWGSQSSYAAVAAFPAGSQRTVYYAPDDPQEAVLIPGLHKLNFVQAAFGLVFVTLAGLVGVSALRRTGAPTGWIMHVLGVSVFAEFAVILWLIRG